jgi:hypothetical protein
MESSDSPTTLHCDGGGDPHRRHSRTKMQEVDQQAVVEVFGGGGVRSNPDDDPRPGTVNEDAIKQAEQHFGLEEGSLSASPASDEGSNDNDRSLGEMSPTASVVPDSTDPAGAATGSATDGPDAQATTPDVSTETLRDAGWTQDEQTGAWHPPTNPGNTDPENQQNEGFTPR